MFDKEYKNYLLLKHMANDLPTIKSIVKNMERDGKTVNYHLDEDCCNLLTLLMPVLDNEEVLQYLIDSGSNVNDCNRYGMTPLIASTISPAPNRRKLMQMLLDNGADPYSLTLQYKLLHPDLFEMDREIAKLFKDVPRREDYIKQKKRK